MSLRARFLVSFTVAIALSSLTLWNGGPAAVMSAQIEPSEFAPDTGSQQLGNIGEHIGPRPDLERAIGRLTGCYERKFNPRNRRWRMSEAGPAFGPSCRRHRSEHDDYPRITHEWPRHRWHRKH